MLEGCQMVAVGGSASGLQVEAHGIPNSEFSNCRQPRCRSVSQSTRALVMFHHPHHAAGLALYVYTEACALEPAATSKPTRGASRFGPDLKESGKKNQYNCYNAI